MLVGKRQVLDVQEVSVSQQTIDMNTQRMGRQFGIQPRTQAPD